MASYHTARRITIAGYAIRTLGVHLLLIPGLIGTAIADAVASLGRNFYTTHPEPSDPYTVELLNALLKPLARKQKILSVEEVPGVRPGSRDYSPTAILIGASLVITILASIIIYLIAMTIPALLITSPIILTLLILSAAFTGGCCLVGIGSGIECLGESMVPTFEDSPAPDSDPSPQTTQEPKPPAPFDTYRPPLFALPRKHKQGEFVTAPMPWLYPPELKRLTLSK